MAGNASLRSQIFLAKMGHLKGFIFKDLQEKPERAEPGKMQRRLADC